MALLTLCKCRGNATCLLACYTCCTLLVHQRCLSMAFACSASCISSCSVSEALRLKRKAVAGLVALHLGAVPQLCHTVCFCVAVEPLLVSCWLWLCGRMVMIVVVAGCIVTDVLFPL